MTHCIMPWCRQDTEPNQAKCASHLIDALPAPATSGLPQFEFTCMLCGREGEIDGTVHIRLSDEQARRIKPQRCATCGGKMMLVREVATSVTASRSSARINSRPGYKVAP